MKIPICMVGEDNFALECLRHELADEAAYEIEAQMFSYSSALERLQSKTGPTIAVIDLQNNLKSACWVADEIKSKLPNVHMLMTDADNEPEKVLRAVKAGAEGFLTQPLTGEKVLNALDAIRNKIGLATTRVTTRGKVIAVASIRGGVGTTTAAVNIAANLARRNQSVCLIDLVLQFGSVNSFLDLAPADTILDVVAAVRRGDFPFRRESLAEHSSGIRVLAEPFRGEELRRISPAEIDETLDILAHSFDFVVIDTPKGCDDILSLVLDNADIISFVTEMDIPSLKSARRVFDLFRGMGIDKRKIRLLLNRYVKNTIVNLKTVEECLGIPVFWTLPNNYPVAVAAINQGLSMEECSSSSDIAKSYSGLTDAIIRSIEFSGRISGRSTSALPAGLFERCLNVRSLFK
jgi:pilus assembly protein CpaE